MQKKYLNRNISVNNVRHARMTDSLHLEISQNNYFYLDIGHIGDFVDGDMFSEALSLTPPGSLVSISIPKDTLMAAMDRGGDDNNRDFISKSR